jgi:hypothetical protein
MEEDFMEEAEDFTEVVEVTEEGDIIKNENYFKF